MKLLIRILPVFASAILLFSACDKNKEQTVLLPKKIILTSEQQELVDASNQFGFKLLDGLVKSEDPGINVFISPLSIELALSMTLNGAREETNDAMRTAMQFSDLEMSEINFSFKNLMKELLSVDKRVIAEIANSIWYRNTFEVEKKFIDVNKEYYNAEVKALDFASPGAKDIINQWVSEKTKNKIPEIVDEISPDHVMFLINAIYFKGLWQSEFDPDETALKPFYLETGNTKMVPMMIQNETFPFYTGDGFIATDLPYGRGNYSMVVLLPDQGVEVEEIVARLNPADWNEIVESFMPADLNLQFPKFRFSYENQLKEILTEMGMGLAFSDFADFRGINQEARLAISEVKHKTFVEVNEEGTEAAAATSIGIVVTSMPPSYDFNVNRPFIFAIREQFTNAILFIGCVKEPLMEN
jgi:serine protease inhibitor